VTTTGFDNSLLPFSHLATVDMPVTIGGHGFEETSIMGHEQHGVGKGLERCFELFYRREIEVVGGFIKHKHVRATSSPNAARVCSPGERSATGRSIRWVSSPSFAS